MAKNRGPKETAEEKELAKIGFEHWTDYKRRFIPVENEAIERIQSEINDPSMRGEGMANVSTQMAFAPVEQQVARGLTLREMRPGSGGFTKGITNINLDRIASSGLNQANAYGLQRRINIANLQNMIDVGQGKANSGLSGLTQAADAAQRQAIFDARASAAARAALGHVIGTGVGAGFGLYGQQQGPVTYGNVDWQTPFTGNVPGGGH